MMLKFSPVELIFATIMIACLEYHTKPASGYGLVEKSGEMTRLSRPGKFARITSQSLAASPTFNVKDYGATGDGETDDSKAFLAAWSAACETAGSKLLVPSGSVFLVNPVIFYGPCASTIRFQLDGKVIAPTYVEAWTSSPQAWLSFEDVKNITMQGDGVLDGEGSIWWKNTPGLPSLKPMALTFAKGAGVAITGITIQNSPQKHLKVYACDDVRIWSMRTSSPGDSPNTDGINLSDSNGVVIHDVELACGDDCISIISGCSNVEAYNINCGPGHGISIGGLGRDHAEAFVSNVSVHDSYVKDSMYGVRIKTFQGGSGQVHNVKFREIQLERAETGILIDQYYCNGESYCQNQTSAVEIAGVTYEGIEGTYTDTSIRLACSDSTPCRGLTFKGTIDLNPTVKERDTFCYNAFGKVLSKTNPPITCLGNE